MRWFFTLLIPFIAFGMPALAYAHGSASTGAPAGHKQAARDADMWERLWRTVIARADAAANVRVDEANGFRFISSDGIPDHVTRSFPNRNNPNRIAAQSYAFRMALNPKRAESVTLLTPRMAFGVAINGVPFDPFTAEFWNGDRNWNYEALGGGRDLGLDGSNAHVQPNGAYHYHGVPKALLERFAQAGRPILIGYAADGFPIYGPHGYREAGAAGELKELRASYRVKPGSRAGGPGGVHDGTFIQDYEFVDGLGDLDRCNGREGITPEYPGGVYYYVVTAAYPFVPRCFAGTPDTSFEKAVPHMGPGGRGPGPGGAPPPGEGPPRGRPPQRFP